MVKTRCTVETIFVPSNFASAYSLIQPSFKYWPNIISDIS